MPRIDQVRNAPGLEPDVAVVVDAGDLARTGSIATEHADWLASGPVANIDHHISNTGFGSAVWVDPTAAATCEMVALLLPELGVAIDQELATVLLTGIVAGHAHLRPSECHATHPAGRQPSWWRPGPRCRSINRAVYVDKPYSTLALWGLMLAGIGQRCDGRIVFASMTNAMLRRGGGGAQRRRGVHRPAGLDQGGRHHGAVQGGRRGEHARQRPHQLTGPTPWRSPAAFGGGGHARAAGCTVAAPLAEAREQVLAECERELARTDAGSR